MRNLIDLYIKDHEFAWSKTTQRSERYRLYGVEAELGLEAVKLWDAIKGLKPYTKVTTWTRVTKFWDWLIKEGHRDGENLYRSFRHKHARLFKNAYVKRPASITVEEAKRRIALISDEATRKKATDTLRNGLRFSDQIDHQHGEIRGKGGKVRELLGPIAPGEDFCGSYQTFYRHLKHVGLKPHELRKIFASALAQDDMNVFDLCRVLGWEKTQTALSYVTMSSKQELKNFVRKSLK